MVVVAGVVMAPLMGKHAEACSQDFAKPTLDFPFQNTRNEYEQAYALFRALYTNVYQTQYTGTDIWYGSLKLRDRFWHIDNRIL